MNDTYKSIHCLPPFADSQDFRIEPAGGRTSRNFVVRSNGRCYFVRLNTEEQQLHSIQRACEFAAIKKLAAMDLGPEAIYFCPETQIIVTNYLNASVWTPEQVQQPDALRQFGHALSLMHQIPSNGCDYDITRVLQQYLDILQNTDLIETETYTYCQDLCNRTTAAVLETDQGFCHNDLWYGNFLNADSIKFVDLELSGLNDIYFDLASFIHFHTLSSDQTAIFLAAYRTGELSSEKLALMRQTVLLREYLWALTQRYLGSQDTYYIDYSAECLDSLQVSQLLII